jgi:hypothetical protein
MSKTIFTEIVMALPREQPKLSPHTEFGIPPHITALPTTTGRGGYIFVVSFHVLYIIYRCCITMSQKKIQFIIYMVLPLGNSRNSAHRLSFASGPAPLP